MVEKQFEEYQIQNMETDEELITEVGNKCLNNSSHNDHLRISPNKYKVSCKLNVS